MTQIIPPFVAPDDVDDDGKWLQFKDGQIRAAAPSSGYIDRKSTRLNSSH